MRPCSNCAAPDASATVIERDGAPRTWMLPRPSVTRSPASTSSFSAAASSRTPRASSAAAMTALPTRWVPREAKLPMQCGPVSESAVSTNTSSTGTPRASAQIWRTTLFMPWPRSIEERATVNFPPGLECTSAWLGSPPRFIPIG